LVKDFLHLPHSRALEHFKPTLFDNSNTTPHLGFVSARAHSIS
jgi:hypothetical protein